ncbi:VacJ family lipoprotein [Alysiella sp.]|uniref:MlaA family lipoprotein n=1 Tax=Alysiella sp. TaxID=1872483 RepID=UPI0026DC928B|nr:VacJ family lipoprotein [Alysiella sp.]
MNYRHRVTVLCTTLLLAVPVFAEEVHDPYEGFNRAMFSFNEKADQYILRPIAKTYRAITPKPARTAVRNFFDNLRDVQSFASNILRGNIKNAGYDFMRVAVNTTFGLGGLINIADEAGMQNNKNTLGDTFASWGWKNSNYLVVPFVGPSTVRDTLGSAISTVYSVERAVITDSGVRYTLTGTNVIDRREGLLGVTDSLDEMALDKYIVTRDAYMALRNKSLGHAPETNEVDDLPDPEAPVSGNTESQNAPSPHNEDVNAMLPEEGDADMAFDIDPVNSVAVVQETENQSVSSNPSATVVNVFPLLPEITTTKP